MPPKIQRSIWELILVHLPSTNMLAQYLVEVLSTALSSLVVGLTSLKIWSIQSAKKRHLCASISAHSLHKCKTQEDWLSPVYLIVFLTYFVNIKVRKQMHFLRRM